MGETYIGEKGFGFKSVFAVASKVHIRSRMWSFHFEHKEDDSGLGMVTPIPDEPVPLTDWFRTRITITLNDEHRERYARLAKEFLDLPETIGFFLQQLNELYFSIEQVDGLEIRQEFVRSVGTESAHVIKRRTSAGENEAKEERHDFQLIFSEVRNMPTDIRRLERKTSSLILAFPTDHTGYKADVCQSGQYFFAYLPVARLVQLPVC